jgi:hypothetical protein
VRVLIFPGTRAHKSRPPSRVFLLFHVCVFYLAKFVENHRKIQKIAKLVLLETRFQVLPLLFMKFDMKLNTFASILNSRLKGNLYITSTCMLCYL